MTTDMESGFSCQQGTMWYSDFQGWILRRGPLIGGLCHLLTWAFASNCTGQSSSIDIEMASKESCGISALKIDCLAQTERTPGWWRTEVQAMAWRQSEEKKQLHTFRFQLAQDSCWGRAAREPYRKGADTKQASAIAQSSLSFVTLA